MGDFFKFVGAAVGIAAALAALVGAGLGQLVKRDQEPVVHNRRSTDRKPSNQDVAEEIHPTSVSSA